MNKQTEYSTQVAEGSKSSKAELQLLEFLEPKTFKEILKKYRIGIYVAIIVSMLLTIFMLAYKISSVTASPTDFVALNMLNEEIAPVPELAEEVRKEKLEEELEALLHSRRTPTSARDIRNVVVNTGDRQTSTLKDSKGINESVYDEARQLQAKMDANRKAMQELQETDNSVPIASESAPTTTTKESYQGPSVLSYTLEGRRAIRLPIPAYKCERGGDVTVIIEVNPNGYVVNAEIDKARSSSDPTLQDTALRAARSSRFTASSTAPKKQQGTIVYRFIAQ